MCWLHGGVSDDYGAALSRELFTDAGKYAIHFGAEIEGEELYRPPAAAAAATSAIAPTGQPALVSMESQPVLPPAPIEAPLETLTERAIALATAITVSIRRVPVPPGNAGGGLRSAPWPSCSLT